MNQSCLIGLLLVIPYVALSVIAEGFTENRTVSLHSARLIKINGRLVSVSFLESGSIEITSLNAYFAPCKLNLDKELHLNWGTTSLGNGNIIVWNYQAMEYIKQNFSHREFAIIDPVKCTLITTVKKDAKEGTSLGGVRAVLPYRDSFDIFSEDNNCTPCRYKNDGTPIELNQSVYKPLQINYDDTFIKPIGDNAESGYLFIERSSGCSTLLKLLSPTFEVLKEHVIDRYFETASTDYGRIRLCSSSDTLGRDNITHDCQLFDFKLKNDKPLERVTEKDNSFIELVQNLPDGGAISAFVSHGDCFEGDGEGAFGDVYIKRIRPDGHVESEQKFETVACWHYDFENFLLQDGKYCLVAYDGVSMEPYPQTIFIKCLKYDK